MGGRCSGVTVEVRGEVRVHGRHTSRPGHVGQVIILVHRH